MAEAILGSGRSAGLGHQSNTGARFVWARLRSGQAHFTSRAEVLQVVCREHAAAAPARIPNSSQATGTPPRGGWRDSRYRPGFASMA